MKRFTLTMSITLMALALTSEPATAQGGRGRSGGSVGPPPASERGQVPDRSNRPTRESSELGSANRQHQTQSKMTVSDHLERNTHLAARLQGILTGTDLQQASSGFKNLGQFVAAAHVSKNLGIPFDQLKLKMTGDSPISLGKAIQELQPEVDAKSEVKKAEQQAREEIRQAEAARKNENR